MGKFGLVIHGGAGTILKSKMTQEMEEKYISAMEEALQARYVILERGGTSLDAVETAINVMENSPLFNAGKGAVFTSEGKNEMDASIMDGSTLNAGAVGGVTNIKNPISAARAVMEKSSYVMLMGKGAELFAEQNGLEIVDPDYFYDERRWQQLQKIKDKEENKIENMDKGLLLETNIDEKYGTVGAVALDQHGNLAAATSTGGMTNKKYGRIGDSPIIGAGTYANNNSCAVSSTGHGEYFIRSIVAYDISALMQYKGLSLEDAANEVIHDKLKKIGGNGGIIAIDKDANITMPFNTTGMYRGSINSSGEKTVKIYKD